MINLGLTMQSGTGFWDRINPIPGGSGVISISAYTYNSISLSWTKATDNYAAQSALEYKVVRSLSNNISTVATAEANGTIVQNWTADINSATATGLTLNTLYYFNVIVRDKTNNKAVYTTKSQYTVVVQDSFNRTDAATLGTADSGQTWATLAGDAYQIPRISGNTAMGQTSGNNHCIGVINCGVADCTISLLNRTITGVSNAGGGIIFRGIDYEN